MKRTVLIFTRSTDVHADRLTTHLVDLGVDVLRIHKDQIRDYRFDIVGDTPRLVTQDHSYEASDFTAAFIRVLPASFDFGVTDLEGDVTFQNFVSMQYEAIFQEWLFTLGLSIPFFNDFAAFTKASGKAFQRVIAGRVGLSCPDTYVGCENGSATSFISGVRSRGKDVCTKPVVNKNILHNGKRLTRYTEKLRTEHYRDLPDVDGCPIIFQEYVEKRYEIRATVIADQILACRIDSQRASMATATDWRRYDVPQTPHIAYSIPLDVRERLLQFHALSGLRYSAFDLIRAHDDAYYFLETNPFGQWLWIEDLTGLPITRTIASALADASLVH